LTRTKGRAEVCVMSVWVERQDESSQVKAWAELAEAKSSRVDSVQKFKRVVPNQKLP